MGNMDQVRDANSMSCWDNYDNELKKEREQVEKINKFSNKIHYVTINGHTYSLDGKFVISKCKGQDLEKTLKLLALEKFMKYMESKTINVKN